MLTESAFRKLVRASAWYDLLVTAPFATPWTFELVRSSMLEVHERLGLSGYVPPITPSLTFFANLLGSLVVIWSLVRIRSPEPWLGRSDAAARCLFAVWMGFGIHSGLTTILLGFLAAEVMFGAAQLLPYRPSAARAAPTESAAS